ncbi:serine protease [Granulosicoccus sp. 3-233]|uniref:serine protease n=1 Tax=Granulosicoccus sp. 3-233 TaxID=3417969 RepID=UPI003D345C0D
MIEKRIESANEMQGLTFRRVWQHAAKHHIVALWRRWLMLLGLLISTCLLMNGAVWSAESVIADEQGQAASETHAIINDLEITRRVLGGDDAEFGDWPSMVVIATAGIFPLEDRFFCAGTLVAERYVLTAAHCLFDIYGRLEEVSSLRIVAGIHDLSDDEGFEEIDVTNIILHPDYDNSLESPPDDIALLELSNTVDAPVGQLFAGETEEYTDTLGFILGWGATRYSNDQASGYPTILQEARVPLVSLETCNAPISYNGLLEQEQLCAGFSTGAVDTCAGDSGGPLYILDSGQPVQVGITSFGNGCAQANFYGIYTNISHYIPWLSDYISVPEQSADLVASRQASASTDSSPKGADGTASTRSGGALNPAVMLLLVLAAALRLTGCSAHSTEKPDLTDADRQLEFNKGGQRAGIDALRLGLDREAVMQALPARFWQEPQCRTGKTAVRGTGRLFMTEQCFVLAREDQRLADWRVPQISYVLIAGKLSRIDLVLIMDGDRGENPDAATAPAEALDSRLAELLNTRYRQPVEPHLWRQWQDQIRFQPGRGLQFIDGKLAKSLPVLLDSDPRFD